MTPWTSGPDYSKPNPPTYPHHKMLLTFGIPALLRYMVLPYTSSHAKRHLSIGSGPARLTFVPRIAVLFEHVARLPDNIPAHQAMLHQVELSVGRPPDPSWKRPPGRPRTKWTDQLRRHNNNIPIATLWRQAIGRGHPRATLRSEPTTR